MPHPFRKESGPGLSKEVDLYIGQALNHRNARACCGRRCRRVWC